MANIFGLYFKDDTEWKELSAVFPFTTGELLDERLDEATVIFFSSQKSYKPLTEFKAVFSDGDPEYFILANDNSAEMPSGSGRYRHEVYLIERTKLLEGYLCPSITFTNEKKRDYSIPYGNRIYGKDIIEWDGTNDEYLPDEYAFDFVCSVPIAVLSGTIFLPKPKIICEELARWFNGIQEEPNYEASETTILNEIEYTQAIYNDNPIAKWDETPQIESNEDFEIVYWCCFKFRGNFDPHVYILKFQIQIAESISPLKPYTITDCVIRILELASPLFANESPKFTIDGATYTNGVLNAYTSGSQAEKYDKIIAPEFTMTQATLREQLKVIGAYIHAEPWLDKNNVVHFLDIGDQTTVTMGDYISNTLRTDINSYCTEIRSNAQNLVNSLGFAKGVVVEPGNGLYRSLRSETMYVRINEENGIVKTDLPIYAVENVVCGVVNYNRTGWTYEPRDITKYIFEATEYGANLSSFGGAYPVSKSYALYYTIGQKGLHGLFYQPPDEKSTANYSPWTIVNILATEYNISSQVVYNELTSGTALGNGPGPARLVFQITYKPIAPGFVSHGKQYYISGDTPYTQIYNQNENLIETQYFGENMKGVAARLGNVEMQKTYMLSLRSQIPKVGMMLEGYSISAVNTEYMSNFIKCTLGLSKDYNRISEYVGVSSVKRMYEISERQATNRDILLKESIVITSDPTMQDDVNIYFKRKKGFLDAFTFNEGESYKVGYSLFYGYTKSGNNLNKPVLLPIIGRAFGNTVHFALKFKDNYSAGDRSEYISEGEITGYWQNDVPYTNYFGRIYWAKILLCIRDGVNSRSEYVLPFDLPDGNLSPSEIMPVTHLNENSPLLSYSIAEAPMLRLRKDNREILGFNIEAEFKTTEDDIIIGSELAARCRFLNYSGIPDDISTEDEHKYTPTLYVSKTPINKLSKYIDTDDLLNYGSFALNYSESSITINFEEFPLPSDEFKYWCIAMPWTTVAEKYTDDDGEEVTINTTKGGEILLGGKILLNSSGNPINRILYFRTKRR